MSNNSDFDDPFAGIDDEFDMPGLPDDDEEFDLDGNADMDNGLPAESGLEEEDYDEVPAPPASSNSQAQASQPAQESKPFIKTPLGMAVAGACVLVVGLGGVIAVSALTAEPEYVLPLTDPVSTVGTEMTSPGEAPGLPRSPSPINTAPAVGVEQAPSIQQQLADVQATREAQAAEVNLATPIVGVPAQPEQAKASVPVSDTEQSEISKAIERVKAESAEIKKSVMLVNQGIARLSKHVEENQKEHEKLAVQVQAMSEVLGSFAKNQTPAKVEPTKVEQDGPKEEKTIVKTEREKRQRLNDLQVIDTTESGKMTVVKKASNGRVFTLFKGENIRTPYGAFSVEGIQENGSLILVGSKYFIDKELEKAKPKKVVAPVSTKKTRAEARSVSSAPKVATAYTVNAVYDGGNAFGLVNDAGDFKTYSKGERVPGLGVVHGLDSSGNLKVGNSIIKSVY